MSEETKGCRGLLGLVFGHSFRPRYDEKQDYPPNTVENLRTTLAAAIADPLQNAFQTVEEVCNGYQNMDIHETTYVWDICTRCGLVRDRSVTISPQQQPVPQPTATVVPTVAPAGPQPSTPPRVVAVPAKVVVQQMQPQAQKANVPPGAPGSPVVAVPGRGPK